jgi:hypothetical protein
VRLALVDRRQEDDRRVPGALPLPDQLCRLEPIQVRHLHVEQDHREVLVQQLTQRLPPRLRLHQVLAQALEHRLERD